MRVICINYSNIFMYETIMFLILNFIYFILFCFINIYIIFRIKKFKRANEFFIKFFRNNYYYYINSAFAKNNGKDRR